MNPTRPRWFDSAWRVTAIAATHVIVRGDAFGECQIASIELWLTRRGATFGRTVGHDHVFAVLRR